MADAHGLGPCVGNDVGVRLLSSAHKEIRWVCASREWPHWLRSTRSLKLSNAATKKEIEKVERN